MTLDITKVASQVGEMVVKIKSDNQIHREHLKCAVVKLCDKNINLEMLKHKIDIAQHKTPWPVAGLYDGLDKHYPVPAVPEEYTVLATDGSHIDVDRHRAARCYLINIGAIKLHYGAHPYADLDSVPHLYSEEKDLVIKNEGNKHREQNIEGALLDVKRAVEECRKLAEMAAALPDGESILALMDGSLVVFGLDSSPQFVVDELINRGFIPALDTLMNLNTSRRLTLASYISLPRSDDVVNALRIAICPQTSVDCDSSCQAGDSACDAVSGINDRMLFGNLLNTGERSAIFISPSRIMKHYGRHQVYFFYLRVDDEIARVEVPECVAMNKDKGLLDLTHALVLDQCRRGQGYPVALSEAHEKAVVTGADREEFWELVEESLVEEKIPTYTSTKSQSKRTRWI
jgi:hypothetical protein